MEVMKIVEFAEHIGVSKKTIYRKIQSGILTDKSLQQKEEGYPDIIVEPALAELQLKTDLSRKMGTELAQGKKNMKAIPDPKGEGGAKDPKKIKVQKADYADESTRFAKARAESEENKARLSRLKIEEQEGTLLDADTMKKTIIKLVGETREALLNIPDNLGPELLACTDLLDLQNKMTEGINQALLNLSRFKAIEVEGDEDES